MNTDAFNRKSWRLPRSIYFPIWLTMRLTMSLPTTDQLRMLKINEKIANEAK